LLRELILGAVRCDALPVRHESFRHLSAEQYRVARVGQLIDECEELLVHCEGHPVELSFRYGDKAVDRHLYLQLELFHSSLRRSRFIHVERESAESTTGGAKPRV